MGGNQPGEVAPGILMKNRWLGKRQPNSRAVENLQSGGRKIRGD